MTTPTLAFFPIAATVCSSAWLDKGKTSSFPLYLAKVPGGWLLRCVGMELTLTFVPDPNHEWDGGSLD